MRKITPFAGLALALTATAALAAAAAAPAPPPAPAPTTAPPPAQPFTLPKGALAVGPIYTTDPAVTDLGAPRGKTFVIKLPMRDSRIFRGDIPYITPPPPPAPPAPGAPPRPPQVPLDPATWERQVTVYIPAAYRDGDAAAVAYIHDGPAGDPPAGGLGNWFELITRAQDNLTNNPDPSRRLPVFITIATQSAPGRNRSYEYDTMSDRQARFIHDEVMPLVLNHPQIRAAYPRLRFTSDPEGMATIGCSSGGSSAMNMAWFHPEWFRRVIAYSGTFTNNQANVAERAQYPLGAWEYHSGTLKLIENTPKKPIRVFNHNSENDTGRELPDANARNWVTSNTRFADALQKKGYEQRYLYALNAGHCDRGAVGQTMADTLVWLWQGYGG